MRLREPNQVADRPGDGVPTAFEKPLAAFFGAQNFGQISRHGRLFRHDNNHVKCPAGDEALGFGFGFWGVEKLRAIILKPFRR